MTHLINCNRFLMRITEQNRVIKIRYVSTHTHTDTTHHTLIKRNRRIPFTLNMIYFRIPISREFLLTVCVCVIDPFAHFNQTETF